MKAEHIWREGMGNDYQGWKIDTDADCALDVQNQFGSLGEEHEGIGEQVQELLQAEVDKALNVGYLELGGGWPGGQAIATEIEDFDFEAGCASGYGSYTADISIGNVQFTVVLTYEYGYDDAGQSMGCHESKSSELENNAAIEIAAQKIGIELGEKEAQEIINILESQVENYVERNYKQSIDNLIEGFEVQGEEL